MAEEALRLCPDDLQTVQIRLTPPPLHSCKAFESRRFDWEPDLERETFLLKNLFFALPTPLPGSPPRTEENISEGLFFWILAWRRNSKF